MTTLFSFCTEIAEEMRNLLFRVLFVALCSTFVLCVPADDSDFIDEKGKALKNLRGEVKIIIPPHLNRTTFTSKIKATNHSPTESILPVDSGKFIWDVDVT